ncbi:MAG: DUF4249 family protein [Bacteroidia bacterium]|nr:DUF4249 family protein [Bacteroidia bacterium]
MSKLRYIILLLSCFLILSCEERIAWEIQSQPDDRLVVQAVLTDQFMIQSIYLSRTSGSLNGGFPYVEDAEVWVSTGGQRLDFFLDSSRSTYNSEVPFGIKDSQVYRLNIRWQGDTLRAESQLSKVLPVPEIKFDLVPNHDSLLALTKIGEIFDPTQDAMYEVNIDWSHLTDSGPAQARSYFYNFSTIHINEIIRPIREDLVFPKGSIVSIKKLGLNEDFAKFLQSMLIETEWNGNFYFSTSSNTPTNIQPDALGFFSTCAVLTDTLIAQ